MYKLDEIANTDSEVLTYKFYTLQKENLKAFMKAHGSEMTSMDAAIGSALFATQFGLIHCDGNVFRLEELFTRMRKMVDVVETEYLKSMYNNLDEYLEDVR
jgi:hypothetical protein